MSDTSPAGKKAPEKKVPEKKAPEAKVSKKKLVEPTAPTASVDLEKFEPASTAVEVGSDAITDTAVTESASGDEQASTKTKKKAPAPYRLSKDRTDRTEATTSPAGVVDRPHRRRMLRVTVAAAVLALIFAIVAVVAGLKPGTTEVTNQAWIDDAATNEVSAAATTALQTVFSYKADTIDQDQDAARGVLDGDRLKEYNDTADQTKQSVLQTKTTSVAVVTDIGVSVLQDDKAEIVASMDISANQDGVDQGTVQTPVVVAMTRVDGKWLIAQIDNR
ncbi:hypothetical protein ACNHUS_32715 [Actinomycetes bacterium M1A6_2h]